MALPARNGSTHTHVLAAGALATGLALAAAACGSSGGPAASASRSPHHPMASHSQSMTHATSSVFGPDCGMIPRTGMGSLHGMGMDPVVTAATHNPLLSDLTRAINGAGLASGLDAMHTLTVFAPANSAFSKLSGSTMTMMHSRAEVTRILKYHVVRGHVTPAELASGKPLTTLEGSALKPSRMGTVYEVNSADVICGGIQTANATVYIINKVLIPMH